MSRTWTVWRRATNSPTCAMKCWERFKWAICSCADLVHRPMRPSPDCSAPTIRSITIVIKFAKIYNGQNWTPSLAAPLTCPGSTLSRETTCWPSMGGNSIATDNVDSFFDGAAGKQTVVRVGRNADGSGGRDVTVVPTASEYGLRNLDWIDSNRRKVDALSGGKVAYVYMPDTGGAGYSNFNRYFYAQLDKQALVLDERYNQGGLIADYIVSVLGQKHLSNAIERDGKPVHDPQGAIFGPKAMIINQSAGSGGDAMPWYFRKAGTRHIGRSAHLGRTGGHRRLSDPHRWRNGHRAALCHLWS